jgi:chemotaxis-related protein WspD
MQSEMEHPSADTSDPDACWRRIGVEGDRSCAKLAQAVHCRNCPVYLAAGQALFDREASAEYLAECTRQLAEAEEAAAAETLSLLTFRIGPEWLALDAHAVVEVVDSRPIHRVPHRTDRLLLGLANIRGELHLCISLHELLGIESSAPETTSASASSAGAGQRLLVAELGQERWVFPMDEVEGVHRVPADTMEGLPHTVQRNPNYYTEALFSHQNRRIGMLSAPRLFQALERIVR